MKLKKMTLSIQRISILSIPQFKTQDVPLNRNEQLYHILTWTHKVFHCLTVSAVKDLLDSQIIGEDSYHDTQRDTIHHQNYTIKFLPSTDF